MNNIKGYINYIKESNSNITFDSKYKKLIDSGSIRIDYNREYSSLFIYVKESLDIPELEFVNYKGIESGYKKYYLSLPRKIDFGDIISFDEKLLSDLLSKNDKDMRIYLQSIYNDKFGDEYKRKIKIRQLFSNYIR